MRMSGELTSRSWRGSGRRVWNNPEGDEGVAQPGSDQTRQSKEAMAMAVTTRKITSINPATEEELKSFDEFTPEQVDQALAEAHAAFLEWRMKWFEERAGPMRKAAEVLRAHKAEYGRLITLEMGKPIA